MNRLVSAILLILLAVMLISFSVRSTNVLDDLGIDLSVPGLEGDGSDNTGSDDVSGSEDNPGGSDSSEEGVYAFYSVADVPASERLNYMIYTDEFEKVGDYYFYRLEGTEYYTVSSVELLSPIYFFDVYDTFYVKSEEEHFVSKINTAIEISIEMSYSDFNVVRGSDTIKEFYQDVSGDESIRYGDVFLTWISVPSNPYGYCFLKGMEESIPPSVIQINAGSYYYFITRHSVPVDYSMSDYVVYPYEQPEDD